MTGFGVWSMSVSCCFFFFQAEDGIRDIGVTGVQTCALPIYVICSDGDLEEGISAEASSLAGHQKLGNLVMIYDNNKISIEDDTAIAFSEDVSARYAAYGWHVQDVDWTNDSTEYVEDVPALWDAIQAAKAVTDRPSFINLHTILAWP